MTAGERDALVEIKEKSGKHADSDTPTFKKTDANVDVYAASLTGDIWMKVSHKYTVDEVDARLPAGTSEPVRQAVRSIYAGLTTARIQITEGQSVLEIVFGGVENAKANITAFDLLTDGLPRAHPAGYATLFTVALAVGVRKLTMSSCWRPMLGSIAHRAGLGLDVSVLGGTVLNRKELRASVKSNNLDGNKNDKDLVSGTEIKAFKAYEDALAAEKQADAKYTSGQISQKAYDDAKELSKERGRAWGAARDANEPAHLRQYRASLMRCTCVRQLFDPWFIDSNTQDKQPPQPNRQRDTNESTHDNHLHITIDDRKILA